MRDDKTIINLALLEDLSDSFSDVTTDFLFTAHNKKTVGHIISKESRPIILCGLSLIPQIFTHIAADAQLQTSHQDGQWLKPQEIAVIIESDSKSLLKTERIILNFLRHLSAIATLTQQYAQRVAHTQLKILDTRKTTPGLRKLEKYAVSCGGGVNHRMGLYDAMMIKDTHIDAIGDIKKTLAKLPNKNEHDLPVIMEIRNITELKIVLEHGLNKIHRVLLDNMNLDELHYCVQLCSNAIETEASGNLNLENIANVAETGVQFASIGKLTYAAGHVDLSMQIKRVML